MPTPRPNAVRPYNGPRIPDPESQIPSSESQGGLVASPSRGPVKKPTLHGRF